MHKFLSYLVAKVGLAAAVVLAVLLGQAPAWAGLNDRVCWGDESVCIGQDEQLRLGMPYALTPSTFSGVNSSTSIPVTDGYLVVASSGGIVTLTSQPSIKTTYESGRAVKSGSLLVLRGSSDANAVVLQDHDSIAGTKLDLGSTTRSLGNKDIIVLMYDAAVDRWLELLYIAH